MQCISVRDYYHKTELYRFIPPAVFDALEAAYLNGEPTAMIPESEYIKMSHNIILANGSENS